MSDFATGMTQRRPAASERGAAVRLRKLDQYVSAFTCGWRRRHRSGRSNVGPARPEWSAALALIGANPGIRPIALSRATGRDQPTLTAVRRDLRRTGFVARQPIHEDRRSHALCLRPLGGEKLARLSQHAARHDRLIDEIVGASKAELIKPLRRISPLLE
jgi:DNA-binding MarR family transcriptional regulator